MAKFSSYITGDDAGITELGYGDYEACQTFTPLISGTVKQLRVKIYRTGTVPDGVGIAQIWPTDEDGHPDFSGSYLATGAIAGTYTDDTGGAWHTATLSTAYDVTAGTKYALRVGCDGNVDNHLNWRVDESTSTYAYGNVETSDDAGATWTASTTKDFMFEVLGDLDLSSFSDLTTYKKVLAIGNNEVWYGDETGMSELTAANGDINCADQLTLFEAFQKAFIVNGSNLKIVDMVNVKLTHTALTTPHAFGDVLTQDQGSSNIAYMVVDYTNSTKTATYGLAYYGGSATAFNATNAITGSGDGTGFTPTAVTDPPHWYDWTVHPDGASGTLPTKIYLACLWNGRIVFVDANKPFDWGMTRQGEPWDVAYIANDAQTPIGGQNGDFGKISDLIKALIPYNDKTLIIGTASTIDYISGDPAIGGDLFKLEHETGIFGDESWCIGPKGELYFWGMNGIYKTLVPGIPECISEQNLPALVDDEDANPTTHRITMGYDRSKGGIKVCITLLADGSHSNYWYDLRTSGFFPEESASNNHGTYSMFYYDSNDKSYRGLLLGCTDGYIRVEDESTKNDDGTAIESYIGFGPIVLGNDLSYEGIIGPIDVTLAGGGTDGTETDSDDASYKVYVADTAAGVIERMTADSACVFGGTVSGPGRRRGSKKTQTARGAFAAVKLYSNSATVRWLLDHVITNNKPTGRKK